MLHDGASAEVVDDGQAGFSGRLIARELTLVEGFAVFQ
jgi:hypothetical protein